MPEHVTNADLLAGQKETSRIFKEHADDDSRVHKDQQVFNKATTKSLSSVHERLGTLATKEEMEEIVASTIAKMLQSKGKTVFAIIVGAGILFGSFSAIGAGIKYAASVLGVSISHH